MLKNYKQAITLLEEGLTHGISDEEIVKHHDDYFLYLARAHAKLNNLERSNTYFEKHSSYLTALETKEDTVAISLREEELKVAESDYKALEDKKGMADTTVKYLGISLILFLMFTGYYLYQSKRRNEQRFQKILAELEHQKQQQPSKKDEKKHQITELKETIVTDILKDLKKMEAERFYLDNQYTLIALAKKINTNTTYLSKVIKQEHQKSFNAYINDLRITYALKRLKNDAQFRNYSIEGVAVDLGYKSADTFVKYFKKHTGLLPSYYIKKLNKQDAN